MRGGYACSILAPTTANITLVSRALQQGAIAALPTETVYGLAGVAFDSMALAAIFAAKERPTFDPLICHVPFPARAGAVDWVAYLSQQGLLNAAQLTQAARGHVQCLATTFWPGPLTLVLPKLAQVPDLATSGLPTVGIRCPRHAVAQQLLQETGEPLAAPSANRFGRISPTTAASVAKELGDRIDYILDGGACEIGIESSVLLIEPDGRLILLRPGAVAREDIACAAGVEVLTREAVGAGTTPLPSPGLLASHYAPQKRLSLLPRSWIDMTDDERQACRAMVGAGQRIGLLLAAGEASYVSEPGLVVVSLSPTGQLPEVGRNLFAMLRSLDEHAAVDEIWAELQHGEVGLAFAINDRLRKASSR